MPNRYKPVLNQSGSVQICERRAGVKPPVSSPGAPPGGQPPLPPPPPPAPPPPPPPPTSPWLGRQRLHCHPRNQHSALRPRQLSMKRIGSEMAAHHPRLSNRSEVFSVECAELLHIFFICNRVFVTLLHGAKMLARYAREYG